MAANFLPKMRIKSLYIATLIIALIPYFCVSKSKQPIEVPDAMKSPQGYFDPQIRICSTTNSDSCKEIRNKECRYIFPTNVSATLRYCKKEYFNEDGICEYDNSSDVINNTFAVQCICARQVTTCGILSIDGIKLGCIKVPDAPAPPSFYKKFPSAISANIVPVNEQNNSFINPRSKVIISGGQQKNGELLDAKNSNLQKIYYGIGGTELNFLTSFNGEKICTSYLGYGAGIDKNSQPIITECFESFGARKPTNLKYKNNDILIGTNPDNIKLQVIQPKTIISTQDPALAQNQNLNVGDFVGGYVCKSKNSEAKASVCQGGKLISSKEELKCDNNQDICPPGHSLSLDYTQDKASNMLCLDGWSPKPEQYVMNSDQKNEVFQVNEAVFVPTSTEQNLAIINPKNAGQDTLDTVQSAGQGKYFIRPDKDKNPVIYKYDQPRYICYKDTIDNNGFCKNNPILVRPATQITESYKETVFTKNGKPFFLPDDNGENKYSQNICGSGLCYQPPNPYAQDLCVFKHYPIKCKSMSKEKKFGYKHIIPIKNIKLPKKFGNVDITNYTSQCDFIKFEAIGGGASGDIIANDAKSGGSGGYLSANIKANALYNYNLIYVEIGQGGGKSGNLNDMNGGATSVYLASLSDVSKLEPEEVFQEAKSNGKLLLKADGAKKNSVASNILGNDFKEKLLYVKDIDGTPNKSGAKPDVAVPNIFSIDANESYISYDTCVKVNEEKIAIDSSDNMCKSGFGQDNKFFGMGGCASSTKTEEKYFPGQDGAVRITCEKWRNE